MAHSWPEMSKSMVKCVSCLLYINQPERRTLLCGENPFKGTAHQKSLFLAPPTLTECVEWLFTDWCSSRSIDPYIRCYTCSACGKHAYGSSVWTSCDGEFVHSLSEGNAVIRFDFIEVYWTPPGPVRPWLLSGNWACLLKSPRFQPLPWGLRC